MNNESAVSEGLTPLRMAAVVAIVVGLITIGLDSAVYDYLINVKYGAWWAALCVVIVGIVAIISKS